MSGLIAVSWLGTVPGWLTLIAILALGYYASKGQIGPALGYERQANEVLTEQLRSLEERSAKREAELAELRARTDLEPLLASIAGEFANHEKRAQERHASQMELTAELVDATRTQTRALKNAVNGD